MEAAVFSFIILSILVYKTRTSRRLMILLLAGTAACAAYSVWDTCFRERENIEYLSKNEAGEADRDVGLQAVVEGEEPLEVELQVPSTRYTEEEAAAYFEKTAEKAEQLINGEGNSFDRVSHDISLPPSFEDDPVTIEWSSSRPGVLSSAGEIGEPGAGGEEVVLTAKMTLDEYEDLYRFELTVFPKEDGSGVAGQLKAEAEKLNADGTSDRYYLPDEVNGREVLWYEAAETRAGTLSVVLLLLAVFLIVKSRKQKENEEKIRNEELKKAYPELISRILLLSYAGLSLRKVMYRIADPSNGKAEKRSAEKRSAEKRRVEKRRTEKDKKLRKGPVYEEIEKICIDLDNGTGEPEAYERFGTRCSQAGYRPLAVLLSRSASRGGAGLLTALEQEAESSFEEAKRRARAAGDLAAVKLLLPMALMLVVVMIIVLVPSFLSFMS